MIQKLLELLLRFTLTQSGLGRWATPAAEVGVSRATLARRFPEHIGETLIIIELAVIDGAVNL
ncbi:MAG: hypothetical protein Q8L08_08245 [Candidatus Nanopelagicaceae bacterium]|nr:hypothetical protein [Candidatus Nanopelagicaceae bacterium]